jgi:hypothetical protein
MQSTAQLSTGQAMMLRMVVGFIDDMDGLSILMTVIPVGRAIKIQSSFQHVKGVAA